jgi:hypothetical protein
VGGDLRTIVDELLDVDTATLDDGSLHALLLELAHQHDRLTLALGRIAHDWDRRGVWSHDGSRSAPHRLARETGRSVGNCRSVLRDAASLDHMDDVAAAVCDGRLAHDTVRLFGDARGAGREALFAEQETVLVELCAGQRHRDAQQILRYWILRADAQLTTDAEIPTDASAGTLHASTTFDGTVVVDGTLEPIAGAIVTTELDRLIAHLQRGVDDPHATPLSQWRARALVEMAARSATAPADGRRPTPLFTILVGDDSTSRLCELADGTPIALTALAPYLDTAVVESVIFDGPTRVLGVSGQRTFTGALRRGIEVRDRRCTHPAGCDVPASTCDIDHIVPWSEGGETSQANGRVLCAAHNRHPHRRGPTPAPIDAGPPPTDHDLDLARRRWRTDHASLHPPISGEWN